jgi:hypothetical protein
MSNFATTRVAKEPPFLTDITQRAVFQFYTRMYTYLKDKGHIDPRSRMNEATYIALELRRRGCATSSMEHAPVDIDNLKFDDDINTVVPTCADEEEHGGGGAGESIGGSLRGNVNTVWSETSSLDATPAASATLLNTRAHNQRGSGSLMHATPQKEARVGTRGGRTRPVMSVNRTQHHTRANPQRATPPSAHTHRGCSDIVEEEEEAIEGGSVNLGSPAAPSWAVQMNKMMESMNKIVEGAYQHIDYSEKPRWNTSSSDFLSPLDWLDAVMGSFCVNGKLLLEQVATVKKVTPKESWYYHTAVDRRCLGFFLWIRVYMRAAHTNNSLIDWPALTTILRNGLPDFVVRELPPNIQGMNLKAWELQRMKIATIMSDFVSNSESYGGVPGGDGGDTTNRNRGQGNRFDRLVEAADEYHAGSKRHFSDSSNRQAYSRGGRGDSSRGGGAHRGNRGGRTPSRETGGWGRESYARPEQNNNDGWGNTNNNNTNNYNRSTGAGWGIAANTDTPATSHNNGGAHRSPNQNRPAPGNTPRGGSRGGYRGNSRGGGNRGGGRPNQFNVRRVSVVLPGEQQMAKMREEVDRIVGAKFLIPTLDGAVQTKACLDTGSSINMISKELWQRLVSGGIKEEAPKNIQICSWRTSDEGCKPIAYAKFKIQPVNDCRFAQAEYGIEAHVVDFLDPPLLLSDVTAYRMGALSGFELTEELPDPYMEVIDEVIQSPVEWEKVDPTLKAEFVETYDEQNSSDQYFENLKTNIRKIEIQTRNLNEEYTIPSECIPDAANGDTKCALEIYNMLLNKYSDLIGDCLTTLSGFQQKHQLRLALRDKNKLPKVQPERFPDKAKRDAIDAAVAKLLKAKFIEECDCIHTPPQFPMQLVCVKKADKTWRVCLDARPMNDVLADIVWPLPDQEDILNTILEYLYFTKFDLTSSFQQLVVHIDSRGFLVFQTYKGGKTYRYIRIPFGIKMATSFFQWVMQKLLGDFEFVRVYVDDIIVFSKTASQHIIHVKLVLERLRGAGFRFNTKKCAFAFNNVIFLGKHVTQDGLKPSEEYYKKLIDLEKPSIVRQMRTWCGKITWIRHHIPNIGQYLKPLYDSIPTKSSVIKTNAMLKRQPIVWTEHMNNCWEKLRVLLAEPITLAKFKPGWYTYMETDASDVGIGAYLFQKQFQDQERRHSIGFYSEGFDKRQQRWSTYDHELYAIVRACEHWKHYLLCNPFTVYTDHRNLTFWEKAPSMKVERWLIRLQLFPMRLVYVRGEDNIVADTLSRVGHEKFTFNTNETVKFKVARVTSISALEEQMCESEDEVEENNNCEGQVVKDSTQEIFTLGISKPICKLFHNSLVGHKGKETLLKAIQEAGLRWNGMKMDISKFVDSCLTCQLGKFSKNTNSEMSNIAVHRPFEQIALDTIGPFPVVSTEGFKYVLCFIDAFTRFCFLVPTKSLNAVEAADALLLVVGLFGTPRAFKSDHGTQFDNQIVRNLFKLMGAKQQFSIEYWSRTNGIVERVNGEVGRHLRALLRDARLPKTQFAILLPVVQRIINSTYHSAIGMSPAKLLFGDRFNLNRVLLPGYDEPIDTSIVKDSFSTDFAKEYYDNLIHVQKELLDISQQHQMKVLNNRAKYFAKGDKRNIKTGSYVVALPKTPRTKLDMPRIGPFKVVDWQHSDSTALLCAPWSKKADEQGNIIKLKSELSLCDLSAVDGELDDIVPDPEQWEIQKIVGHIRKSTGALKGLFLRVRWTDFEPSDDEFLRADLVPRYLLEEYCTLMKVEKPQFLKDKNNALIAEGNSTA